MSTGRVTRLKEALKVVVTRLNEALKVVVPRVNEALEVVVKFGLIVGAIVAFVQYQDARSDLRLSRTLDYISRFETDGFAKARQALDDAVTDSNRSLGASPNGGRRDPAFEARIVLRIAYDINDGQGLYSEISQIIGFFNSLETCIEMKLCDRVVAHRFFDRYASKFWSTFQPFVAHRRQTAPGYADAMQRFVGPDN